MAKILVVDDDPDILETLRYAFEQAGYSVESEGDGEAPLRHARRRPPDLAVLDVQLPDGRGFEVLGALRKHAQPCGVVMMTGDPGHRTVAHSIEMGVMEFLPKPFRADALLDAMHRAHETTAA